MAEQKTLIWLPSPIGDAILCTPALRALGERLSGTEIHLLASPTVRDLLSPCGFPANWIETKNRGYFGLAAELRRHNFSQAILFKNSFGSALTTFLARIPQRIGYAREGRSLLLTDKLHPPRTSAGRLKPVSMVDYYCAIAAWLGADIEDTAPRLSVTPEDNQQLQEKLGGAISSSGPIVVLVPGGAFGPAKCWPADRFALIAGRLIADYGATVVVCVAPVPAETKIARDISRATSHKLVNLADCPLTMGPLKALFQRAELVISNDTGPRHIAIALDRKVVTLFGPNDPAWTQTNHPHEIEIVADVPCAPCQRPVCKLKKRICMEAISVDMVYEAAARLLKDRLN